jgi:DNA-damage-inducible protein D
LNKPVTCLTEWNAGARELQEIFNYTDWRNFLKVVDKAKEACKNSGEEISDHFVDVNKMVQLGSGSERALKNR